MQDIAFCGAYTVLATGKCFTDHPFRHFVEAGYTDMVLPSLAGVMAPAGLPRPVSDKLITEIGKIVRSPEFAAKLFDNGYQPAVLTGDQFADYIKADIRAWTTAVKAYDIKVD